MFLFLRTPRRRLAGGEGCSRPFQMGLKCRGERVRATEHAPRCPFYFLECRHRLAEIVERGGGVLIECPRVIPPRPERKCSTFPENTSRQGYCFARQGLGLFLGARLDVNSGSNI